MPDEKENFNLIDSASDVLGGLAGVTVAAVHQNIAGLYAGAAIGTGLAHTLR